MMTTYLTILTAVSILAPFVIEGLKKQYSNKENFDINKFSSVTTAIIALVSCIAYMVTCKISITPETIVYTIGTVFFSILGSLCGYDKMFSILFSIFKKGDK